MPIDPRIPLGVQVADIPGAMARTTLQFGQMLEFERARQEEMAAQQQQMRQQQIAETFRRHTGPDGRPALSRIIGDLYWQGFPDEAMKLEDRARAIDRDLAAQATTKLQSQATALEMGLAVLGGVRDQATYDSALAQARDWGVEEGVLGQFPRSYDPDLVERVRTNLALGLGLNERQAYANRMLSPELMTNYNEMIKAATQAFAYATTPEEWAFVGSRLSLSGVPESVVAEFGDFSEENRERAVARLDALAGEDASLLQGNSEFIARVNVALGARAQILGRPLTPVERHEVLQAVEARDVALAQARQRPPAAARLAKPERVETPAGPRWASWDAETGRYIDYSTGQVLPEVVPPAAGRDLTPAERNRVLQDYAQADRNLRLDYGADDPEYVERHAELVELTREQLGDSTWTPPSARTQQRRAERLQLTVDEYERAVEFLRGQKAERGLAPDVSDAEVAAWVAHPDNRAWLRLVPQSAPPAGRRPPSSRPQVGPQSLGRQGRDIFLPAGSR